MWDPYAMFKRHVLPNGLEVYAAEWPDRDFVNLDIIIHSGSERDPIDYPGTAHYLEHVMGENGPQSREEMQASLADHGGGVSWGSTSWTGVTYGFFLPAERVIVSQALELFGSMLVCPRIKNGVEMERGGIIGEWHETFPQPALSYDLDLRMRRALYGTHPLANFVDALGTLESIELVSAEVLQAQCDRWYTPANMTVVAIGKLSATVLCDLLAGSPFAHAMAGERAPIGAPLTPQAPTETYIELDMSAYVKGARNGTYKSVVVLPPSMGRGFLFPVVRRVLEQLLNEEVRRQSGWTYSISCSQHTFRDAHELEIRCQSLAPEGFPHIHRVVNECIEKAASRRDLFERETRRRAARMRLGDEDSDSVLNGVTMDLLEQGYIQTRAEMIAGIEALTFTDFKRALELLAPENRWTVLATP